jgi:Niemann-Pick C1 protein
MKINFIILNVTFGKCQACVKNLMDMWCSYTCSPYQGNFVIDLVVDNATGLPLVKTSLFFLNPDYAEQIYESCQWIELGGGSRIKGDFIVVKKPFFIFDRLVAILCRLF